MGSDYPKSRFGSEGPIFISGQTNNQRVRTKIKGSEKKKLQEETPEIILLRAAREPRLAAFEPRPARSARSGERRKDAGEAWYSAPAGEKTVSIGRKTRI